MSYTQDQITAIKNAIALGALEVRYADGRTVKYRSLDEMRSILAEMENALGVRPRRNNFTVATYRRG
jgi:hypothetical protein